MTPVIQPGTNGQRVHVELFAGGGGWSRSAAIAGGPPTLAVENSPGPIETYRHNFPGVELVTDPVQKVDWPALAARLGDVDLVTAGPPCEPFTPAKAQRRADPVSRLYEDPVGGLVLHTILALRALKPRAFVIENVVQLAEGPLQRELADLLRRAGYKANFNILRAEHHGTPSTRARLFISNLSLDPPEQDPITVRKAIGDLEVVPGWDYREDEEGPAALDGPDDPDDAGSPGRPDDALLDVPNHWPDPVPRTLRDKLPGLRAGQSLRWWKGATGKTYGTWTRLDYDRVAPTIKGSGRFVHPVLDRALTPREHARLMGFPDEHVFLGTRHTQYDQVGEAVPPPLGAAILSEVHAALEAGDV